MKIKLQLPLAAGFFITGSFLNSCLAQSETPKPKVRIHTVMERYEPGFVLPAEERLRLKVQRREAVENRTAVIDTLDIPERKRRKLLRELYRTPFTDKYDQVLSALMPKPAEESGVD
jgi:hypothetical protein